jgi:hypothetical protein
MSCTWRSSSRQLRRSKTAIVVRSGLAVTVELLSEIFGCKSLSIKLIDSGDGIRGQGFVSKGGGRVWTFLSRHHHQLKPWSPPSSLPPAFVRVSSLRYPTVPPQPTRLPRSLAINYPLHASLHLMWLRYAPKFQLECSPADEYSSVRQTPLVPRRPLRRGARRRSVRSRVRARHAAVADAQGGRGAEAQGRPERQRRAIWSVVSSEFS